MSDFLPEGLEAAEILNPRNNEVVRTLTRLDNNRIGILAGDGSCVTVPDETPIRYQPWDGDRGSLLFESGMQTLKICTELDLIRPLGMTGTVTIHHPKGIL